MDRIISTGNMIETYLEANGFSITNLAESSGVSERTIYRLLNDEGKLTQEMAEGVNKLIPGISVEFLMTYDARYQIQKRDFVKANCNSDIDALISKYKLKKLFPSLAKNKEELFNHGKAILGLEQMNSGDISNPRLLSFQFSQAANPKESDAILWLTVAYKECLEKNSETKMIFNKERFEQQFDQLKELCGATTIENSLSLMNEFANSCGIYFFLRRSIPNARIKAVTIKDSDNRIIILMSDLFKCVETLWIAFIHECFHILNDDFDEPEYINNDRASMNEKNTDKETLEFLVSDCMNNQKFFDVHDVLEISSKNKVPVGIVASFARDISGKYKDSAINSCIHYYKPRDLEACIRD